MCAGIGGQPGVADVGVFVYVNTTDRRLDVNLAVFSINVVLHIDATV
jgi:hypothetical protein